MPGSSDVVILLGLVAAAACWPSSSSWLFWLSDRRRSQARLEQLLQSQDRNSLRGAPRQRAEEPQHARRGRSPSRWRRSCPGFRYLPADARFLGDPVDYVIFSGYTDVRDNRRDASGWTLSSSR